MVHQYVIIKNGVPTYNPDPPATLRVGDQVTFTLDDVNATLTVDFGSKTPFVNNDFTFTLNGAVPSLATKDHSISENADGTYSFWLMPPSRGKDPEPPGSPAGDLEVTRDR